MPTQGTAQDPADAVDDPTLPGRQAFLSRFKSSDDLRAHMRQLALHQHRLAEVGRILVGAYERLILSENRDDRRGPHGRDGGR